MPTSWKNAAVATLCFALAVGCAPRAPATEELATAGITATAEMMAARPTESPEPATAEPATATTRATSTATQEPPTVTAEATPTATQEPTATATPTAEPHTIPFPDPPYELGDRLTRTADGTVMVYVPGGTFEMGSLPGSDEWGPHTVTLDGFWIDQTEVTNAQFVALMQLRGNPSDEGLTWIEIEMVEDAQIIMVGDQFAPDPGMDDHPVVEVTWPGAYAYCEWVGGRLPTEAEWEYAARGPDNHLYPWGDEEPTCELAQLGGCGDTSAPVGTLSDEGASWAGAKDMAGNVWEWTADYMAAYPEEPQVNPTGPEAPAEGGLPLAWMNKVSRGGSFLSSPDTLHMAYRRRTGGSQPNLGFRCAADAP